MLYLLLYPLHGSFAPLNVFRYITFRTLLAGLTALTLSLLLGPALIRRLSALQIGQNIRSDGPARHAVKAGTPTMGGALILLAIAISTLLWFDWSNRFVWIVMIVTTGFGAIGWVDDWRKVVHKDPEGMPSREKYFWQSVIGLIAALYLAFSVSETNNLRVLEWMIKRVQGEAGAIETPIGSLPAEADLNLEGLALTEEARRKLFGFDPCGWQEELASIGAYLEEYGGRMPPALKDEQRRIADALVGAHSS